MLYLKLMNSCSFLACLQYSELHPEDRRVQLLWGHPKGLQGVGEGDTPQIRWNSLFWGQIRPSEGTWHHDLLRLWFPWWQLTVWWRGGIPGTRLLPWSRDGRRHSLWFRRAMDTWFRKLAGWVHCTLCVMLVYCVLGHSQEEVEYFSKC